MTPWAKGSVTCSVCGVTFQGALTKSKDAARYCKSCAKEVNRQRSREQNKLRRRTEVGSPERQAEIEARRERRQRQREERGEPPPELDGYKTIYCPGDEFPTGSVQTALSFRATLEAGHYPIGMLVTRRGVSYRVQYRRLERISA